MRLKKIAALAMAAALTLSMFTGCWNWNPEEEEDASSSSANSSTSDNTSGGGIIEDDYESEPPKEEEEEDNSSNVSNIASTIVTKVGPELKKETEEFNQSLASLKQQSKEDPSALNGLKQSIKDNLPAEATQNLEPEQITQLIDLMVDFVLQDDFQLNIPILTSVLNDEVSAAVHNLQINFNTAYANKDVRAIYEEIHRILGTEALKSYAIKPVVWLVKETNYEKDMRNVQLGIAQFIQICDIAVQYYNSMVTPGNPRMGYECQIGAAPVPGTDYCVISFGIKQVVA